MNNIYILSDDQWPVKGIGWWRHVYIIQEGDDGPLKVGIAANAFLRRNELQVGNHRRLNVRAVLHVDSRATAKQIERRVQYDLDRFRIGGEWFDCDLLTALAALEQEAN